jgi:hypothetical protein
LTGQDDKSTVFLIAAKDNRPGIGMTDEAPVPRATIHMALDGSARLELAGKNGKARLELSAPQAGAGSARALNDEGKVTWPSGGPAAPAGAPSP